MSFLCRKCSIDSQDSVFKLRRVSSGAKLYSSYSGKTVSLDSLIESELEKGNKVTSKILSLKGKGLRATWATFDIEQAAVYVWSRDEVENGLVSREEMEDELEPINLAGWFYDPDQDDGDGGNIFIHPTTKLASLTPSSLHSQIATSIAHKAQELYDDWDQDEDGFDEDLGEGGLCDYIADAICSVIQQKTDLDCSAVYNEYDTHTSVYAWDMESKKLYNVDIPPQVYESGYGYKWKKLPGVRFTSGDVSVRDVSSQWNDFIDADGDLLEF